MAPHIVEKRTNAEVISARISYDERYRFRLWLAMVEESDALGKGYRAYYSHIMRSLDAWEKSGTKFVQDSGDNLNISALKDSDIWGFLGKKDVEPKGPQRGINHLKLSVIDVYFKKQNPRLASTFQKIDISVELASLLATFFDLGRLPLIDTSKFPLWTGLYISGETWDPINILRSAREGNIKKLVVSAIMVKPHKAGSCIVHRIELPISPDYYQQDSKIVKNINKIEKLIAHHSPKHTKIYSGIGILSNGKTFHQGIKLSCLMRDRTTYEPNVCSFELMTTGFGDEETRIPAGLMFDGNYPASLYYRCLDGDTSVLRIGRSSSRYSFKLIEELWRICHTLGDEV